MFGRNSFRACIILVILALIVSGCVTPPKSQQGASGSGSPPNTMQGAYSSGSSSGASPDTSTGDTSVTGANSTVTPVPDDTRFLVPVPPSGGKTNTSRQYPVSPEITQIIWNETEIYNNSINFQFTNLAYEYSLTNPPLFIAMKIQPAREKRLKSVYNQTTSKKDDEEITVIQDKPQTWFEIKITNTETGEVVASDGYGGVYSSELQKYLTISSGGKYLFEMNGNNVQVNITMKIRKPAGV